MDSFYKIPTCIYCRLKGPFEDLKNYRTEIVVIFTLTFPHPQ
jgi:hypothetical protein